MIINLVKWRRYSKKLANLRATRERMAAEYKVEYNNPPEGADKQEHRARVHSEQGFELGMIDDEIGILQTQHLRDRAQDRFIEIPSGDEPGMWEESHYLGSSYLTRKGMARVKTQLDADEKAARDAFMAWITPTIGLIGVLIGLVAAFKK
jgi:hypothetical protein